ncbi:MAG: hypothetical protein IID37_14545 [Planctomycetes bacterium]|nr:hypothetical protein [Planctomycetota bacterium]
MELFVGTTTTGEVWSQQPDDSLFPYAFTAVDGSATQDLADDFSFVNDTTLTTARWFGGTFNGDPTLTFRITIHEDASGIPGTSIFGPVPVTPSSATTGRQMDGGPSILDDGIPDEFEFEAAPPGGFTATGGVTYWLEIGGIQTGTIDLFTWTSSSSVTGDGNDLGASQFVDASTTWTASAGVFDRAFELDGEVDTTELRAFGCNLDGASVCPE